MAQANSAQREPSMEEILASIRRIIEDSDTAKQPAEPAPAAAEPASNRSGSVIEVESFRADLRASAEAHEAGRAKPAASPTLADIKAEVKGASFSSVAEEAKAAAAAKHPTLPNFSAVEEALAGASDDVGLDQDEMIAELSERLGALSTFQPEQQKTVEPKSGILSEQAGRQVAAAFGELNEAFSANRRRSFEELAEEMMRPMLQDWLDNNLPALVERLVREEIERVARGAGS
ncbi:MAG: PopZ family protein [Rhizobiaceae bacterium]